MTTRPMAAIVVAVLLTVIAAREGQPRQAGTDAWLNGALRVNEALPPGHPPVPEALPEGHPPVGEAMPMLPEGHPPVPWRQPGCPRGGLELEHGFDGATVLQPSPRVIAI